MPNNEQLDAYYVSDTTSIFSVRILITDSDVYNSFRLPNNSSEYASFSVVIPPPGILKTCDVPTKHNGKS